MVTRVAYASTTLQTYYFRRNFNLTNVNCYEALYIDVVVEDGVVVYLNNVEILRLNLNPGYLDNKTNV